MQLIRANILDTSISLVLFTITSQSNIKNRVEKAVKYDNCIHKFKRN